MDPVGGGARVPFPTAISTDKWVQLGHSAAEEPPRHVLGTILSPPVPPRPSPFPHVLPPFGPFLHPPQCSRSSHPDCSSHISHTRLAPQSVRHPMQPSTKSSRASSAKRGKSFTLPNLATCHTPHVTLHMSHTTCFLYVTRFSSFSTRSGEGGLLDAEGRGYRPNVVRVGPNIKESLLDVSIDTLAKERQAAHAKRHTDPMSYDAARMAVLNEAQASLASLTSPPLPIVPQVSQVSQVSLFPLCPHVTLPFSRSVTPSSPPPSSSSSSSSQFQIVCTTLSCAGYSMFSQCKQGFDTVLIDEASQAVEVSTLIPLKYGCRRLILVGDPKQLPATVFSEPATQHNYEQSLFHRLQRGGHQVALLTTQYRMLPQISRFPAARFYKGALDDAPQLKRAPPMPWHELRCLAPYVFYDVADGRAEVKVSHSTISPHMSHLPWFQRVTPAVFSTCRSSHSPTCHTSHSSYTSSDSSFHKQELNSSWSNALEAQLALHIVRMLLARYSECLAPSAIGVIAPYNGQVRLIRKLLADEFGSAVAAELEVNSVDGFQGREKSVVLVSCVRSDYARQHARGVGFVKDARRINVSMTRAKHSLFILGHARTLEQEEIWAALLDDARERGCVLTASSPLKIWFEAAAKEPCRAEPPTDDISEPQDPEMPAELAPATVAEATKRRRTTRRQQ